MSYQVEQFASLAESTTTADPGTSGTSLAMTSRSAFPQTAPFYIVVQDSETSKANRELMRVTAGVGTGAGSFTVVRGQGGTTGVAHASGSYVSMVLTGESISWLRDRVPMINVVKDYGISTAETEANNKTYLDAVFADAKLLNRMLIYWPGAGSPYPVAQFNLPNAPITLMGDGVTATVLMTSSTTICTYDITNPVPVLVGSSPSAYSPNLGGTTSGQGSGAEGTHYKGSNTWAIKGMGFVSHIGWTGSSGNAFYFPKWFFASSTVGAGGSTLNNPTIPVTDLSNFAPAPNTCRIGGSGGVFVSYTGKTATSGAGNLTGCSAHPLYTGGEGIESQTGGQCLVMNMTDVLISNFNGTSATHAGLFYIISGLGQDSEFTNVTINGCSARGAYMGSDSRLINFDSHSNGEEGIYIDGYIVQGIGLKVWGNGQLSNAGNRSGIKVVGGHDGHLTNVYAQDNNGPAITLVSCNRFNIDGLSSDRNNWNEGKSGVVLTDSTNVEISGLLSTDSKNTPRALVNGAVTAGATTINYNNGSGGSLPGSGNVWVDGTIVAYTGNSGTALTGCTGTPALNGGEVISLNGAQLHAIKVNNTNGTTNDNNTVELRHSMYDVGYYIEQAVDPASNLNGTNIDTGDGVWRNGVEQITTADHTGIGTTATNVAPATGPALTAALNNGKTYEFDALLIVDSSSTAGLNVGAAFSGTITYISQYTVGEGTTTFVSAAQHASGVSAAVFSAIATTKTIVHVKGMIKAGAAGNLTIQAKKVTSGTCGVYTGSRLTVRQMN